MKNKQTKLFNNQLIKQSIIESIKNAPRKRNGVTQ